jgi:diaminopimelate decarboxylase
MTPKNVPFSQDFLEKTALAHPTPFHIYDEKAIRENARALNAAFA